MANETIYAEKLNVELFELENKKKSIRVEE